MEKQDRETRLREETRDLTASFRRWETLFQFGGQDPFWADGVNLNLVRNHILYHKDRIRDLLEEEQAELSFFGLEYPDIYYKETPPEVASDYMARPEEIRRRAHEQIALYEADPNFQYILETHPQVFANGETKATKNAGLYPGACVKLIWYRREIEADDLVAMRRDFREDYAAKAARWAETAQKLKAFLETEHAPEDDVSVKDEWEADEDEAFEEEPEEPDDEAKESLPEVPAVASPPRKPSLAAQIGAADSRRTPPEPPATPRETQLSFF